MLIIIMALLEMIGVASIMPFMAVLTNPSLVETNLILNYMFKASSIFGVENNEQFLFALGVLVFILLVTSISFKAFTTYVQIRFVQSLQYNISRRLMEKYLSQSYSWFLSRNSADFSKTILSETGIVIGNGVNALINLIAKSMVTIALLSLLVIANPKIALIAGFSLIMSYLLIYKFTSKYVSRMGEERFKKELLLFKSISEAFGAVKEIKLSGLEQIYIKRFSDPARTIAKNLASSSVIQQFPRFVLEAVAFGGIMLLILYQMKQTGSFNNALPVISLYALAGYRLMPALQEIYGIFSKFDFVIPSIDKIHSDFKNLKILNVSHDQRIISVNKTIDLKNIYYNYPNTSRTALKNINLSIPVNTTIGLVGSTGSGKTTTVDIILGLLEAQKGTLEIDKQIITKQNSRAWQKSIGYVPQYIYLSDDTIAANIAFGVEAKDINQEAVEKASKIAKIHEFIVNELPEQYDTTVGERGVRLSGGQRQRIGIARALYHNPKILILDEATNALDNLTEQAVMDAVNNLNKHITLILIAHRLNTVRKCDKIYLLEKGEIKSEGTFDELIKVSENFRISANN
ncbi:ABC transporter ATP-binding protein/permease [Candidatus Pelagibacter sp.]|nr:ABC transporter ATP-binding protein/permease [Candidatus Pelagibacter sp.]